MVKYIQNQIDIEKKREQERQLEIEQRLKSRLMVENDLFDVIEYYIGKNQKKYIYPCFLEKEITGKLYKEDCEFCVFLGVDRDNNVCTYRFKDIEISDITKIVRAENSYISDIVLKNGNVKKYEKVDSRLHTIEELWNNYGGDMLAVMRCANLRTRCHVQIKNSPAEQIKKFGRIDRKISYDGKKYRGFFEIFRADKKEWKMEWFMHKTKQQIKNPL